MKSIYLEIILKNIYIVVYTRKVVKSSLIDLYLSFKLFLKILKSLKIKFKMALDSKFISRVIEFIKI